MVSPNSLVVQIVVVVAAVGAAVAAAWAWREIRGRWRWPVRVAALALSALTMLSSAVVAVNRQLNLIASWTELVGGRGHGDRTHTVVQSRTGSRVIEFTLRGRRSGISLPAYAYLPPGYDSPTGQLTRYPVIEAVDGFPGSPNTWLISLHAGNYLDAEIAAGRMAPTVVVFPTQVVSAARDSECVNAAGGAQFETYLTGDVHEAVTTMLRVRPDRAGWSIVGTSTGGFCAVNLALRNPTAFGAAASLSGYFTALTDRTTGDLYHGNLVQRQLNSPLWRVQHLRSTPTAIYLGAAADDPDAYRQLRAFATAAPSSLAVKTVVVPHGGHTGAVWCTLEPSVFDWLSGWMAAPEPVIKASPSRP